MSTDKLIKKFGITDAATVALVQEILEDLNIHQEELRVQYDELVATQQSLEQVKENYKNLFDFSPVGIFSLDQLGRIDEVNIMALRMLGRGRADLLQHFFRNLIATSEDRDAFIIACERARDRGETISLDLRLRVQDQSKPMPVRLAVLCQEQEQRVRFRVTAIDINEHHQVLQALRKEQEQLKEAQRIGMLGSWTWCPRSGRLHWSDQLFRIYGLSPLTYTPSYERFLDLIHPDDRDYFKHWTQRVLGGISPYSIEYRLRLGDGEIKYVRERGEAHLDDAGQVVELAGTVQDITDYNRMEQRVRANEARFRDISECSSDGIWELDAMGRFVFVSTGVTELLDYRSEEMLGRTPFDFMAPTEAARVRPLFEAIARERRVFRNLENRCLHKEGHDVVLDTSGVPILDERGELLGYRGTDTDITQRKAAEQVLVERESMFRNFFENAPLPYQALDEAGRIIVVNRIWQDMLGYRAEAVVGRSFTELMLPDYLDKFEDRFRKFKLAGEIHQVHFELRRYDGTVIEVSLHGRIGVDPAGKFLQTHCLLENVTERKHRMQELERLVDQRTADLKRAEQGALEASRVKSEFLANMSHEIRTPLNAVLGLARMGRRDHSAGKASEIFSKILDAGDHLMHVINDILDFSRSESGELRLEAIPFQLPWLVERTVRLMIDRADEKGLDFHWQVAGHHPEWVEGDPHRLNQILLNLLGNAIKFTERGSVVLTVDRVGEESLFIIEDSGVGMSADQLERVFHAFSQADSSTTRLYGGSGLGLAISRNLANLMGGEIRVESEPERGSRFTLKLPLGRSQAPQDAGLDQDSAASGTCLREMRVLVAEDVEVNRLILQDLLEDAGIQVTLAEHGLQALGLVAQQGPGGFDAVLMDVQMPLMDGYQAARRIRAIAPHLPIIGCTAHAMAEERDRCLAAGMQDHISKPIEPDRLLALLQRYRSVQHKEQDRLQRQTAPSVADAGPSSMQPTAAAEVALVDWDELYSRLGHRPGLIAKLVSSALGELDAMPESLRRLAAAEDADQYVFEVHRLKNLAGNISAPRLYQLSQQVEKTVRSGQGGGFTAAEGLAQLTDAFQAELRQWLLEQTPADAD